MKTINETVVIKVKRKRRLRRILRPHPHLQVVLVPLVRINQTPKIKNLPKGKSKLEMVKKENLVIKRKIKVLVEALVAHLVHHLVLMV